MAQGNDLPNVFRTDVRAYIEVNGQHYPVSLAEIMYRMDEIPYAYMEIPMGRKVPRTPATSSAEMPGAGPLIAELNPMTPVAIKVKCTAYGNPPEDKLKGYVDGQWMTVFSGYALSPWVRKRRTGYASLALTAMGELGKLASSTNYVSSVTPDRTNSTINIPGGTAAGVVQAVTTEIRSALPADDLARAIRQTLEWLISKTIANSPVPFINNAARTSVLRLTAVSSPNDTPTGLTILGGAAAKALAGKADVAPAEFNKMLQWSVARHLSDLLYSGWAHGLQDGGGDLWTVVQMIARSFLFGIVATARSKDFLVPIYYGLRAEPYRIIGPNEYWAVEMGKTFTPKDFAYVSSVLLYSPRSEPVVNANDGNTGFGFSVPMLGMAGMSVPRAGVIGRTQLVECPSWAVPPANLTPEVVAENGNLPDAGSPDDPIIHPLRPAADFWYDIGLGTKIADWTLGFLEYVHRVISITGRLRFDIAPGSLVRVTFTEDLYTKQSVPKYNMYGYVAEIRTSIGSRGRGTSAHTIITLSHVHNDEEHKRWINAQHPVFGTSWTGTHLVEGADK